MRRQHQKQNKRQALIEEDKREVDDDKDSINSELQSELGQHEYPFMINIVVVSSHTYKRENTRWCQ